MAIGIGPSDGVLLHENIEIECLGVGHHGIRHGRRHALNRLTSAASTSYNPLLFPRCRP